MNELLWYFSRHKTNTFNIEFCFHECYHELALMHCYVDVDRPCLALCLAERGSTGELSSHVGRK